MKNFSITAYLLLLIILVLGACISHKGPYKPDPPRGKIITGDRLDSIVTGELYILDEDTKGYIKTGKTFDIPEDEFPCWFESGIEEDGDEVFYEDIKDSSENKKIDIVGYLVNGKKKKCHEH